MGKCFICKVKTVNKVEDIFICNPCEGKYGNKLGNKIQEIKNE